MSVLPFKMGHVGKKFSPDSMKYFKCENETGEFEVSIYLNGWYKLRYFVRIVTNGCELYGEQKLSIARDGRVYVMGNISPVAQKTSRISTGFVLNSELAEEICDYVDALKNVSETMKKYNVKRVAGKIE